MTTPMDGLEDVLANLEARLICHHSGANKGGSGFWLCLMGFLLACSKLGMGKQDAPEVPYSSRLVMSCQLSVFGLNMSHCC